MQAFLLDKLLVNTRPVKKYISEQIIQVYTYDVLEYHITTSLVRKNNGDKLCRRKSMRVADEKLRIGA